MRVIWTSEAQQDRNDVRERIAADNPRAALRMDQLFSDAVTKLADFPNVGRLGEITGTRELIPHESYRIVYEAVDDTVWVLAVVHTARQWPPVA
ncbi:type II toxin-antitoxin system RelE/ParE family toxin [Trinickia fusca]|uniref:Type II toxin-antitoxin system RelE/ParE family toxin n=1 Tax=Trinickia fusca TaxID=2419777 RepID=A0A494XE78_9BURK|nr:type II toxin-antitoxin system RelE/ParE family toxin [Trinickia fusca]RKP49097.1 type II toxin-antitoxin system RelE/ParE family toxin [Trinickia fusca]